MDQGIRALTMSCHWVNLLLSFSSPWMDRSDPMAAANQQAVFRCWAGKVSSYLDAKDMAMWTSTSKLLYRARSTVRVFEGVRCHNRHNIGSLILFVNTLVGLRVLDLRDLKILENLYTSQIKISGFSFVLCEYSNWIWIGYDCIMWKSEMKKLSNYCKEHTSLRAITRILVDECHDRRQCVGRGIYTMFTR